MAFFDFFTGGGARDDLKNAYGDSEATLGAAYKDASAIGEKYYGQAQGYLEPYLQGGRDADGAVRNALGLNGRDAQSNYYRDFQTDPGFQNQVDYGVKTLDHSAAARGGLYSGGHMKALQRFGQNQMGQAYDGRMNHLMNYGQQGRAVAGTAAGMAQQHGSEMAGMRYGYGQQTASNRINIGNALAQSRGTAMNNFLKIGEIGAKAMAASDRRLKTDIVRLGSLPSGLPLYEFAYVWGPEKHVGVMAQEARELFPDAVIERDGFLMVDYSRIG